VAVIERAGDKGGLLNRWRYAEAGRRDVRLDLLRGYAVFAMIADHASGISWLSPITGGNRFVVSAAEGFVFLAGLVIGMVYGRKIQQDGWVPGTEAILRRATLLYAVTVGLTLLFVGLFQFTRLKLWLDRDYGLGLTDPVELVVGTLTLHYTYHGTDILWMYTILIAASPFIFVLLEMQRAVAVIVGSWLLWAAYQFFPSQATVPWTATNVNYFPVSAWQLIFVNGLVWGYHRDAVARLLGRVPERLALVVFAVGMAFLVLLQRAHDTGRLAGWPIIGWLAGDAFYHVFDKPSLGIGRLAAFVILVGFSYSLVTVFWTPIRRALGWLLLPLGTSSLRAYGVHLLVIVLVYNIDVLASQYDRSRTGNTILQVATLGITLGVILVWKRLEAGVAWRPGTWSWPARYEQRRALAAVATAVVLALTVGGALLAGPVRGARQTDLATASSEAGVLRYVPTEPPSGGSRTILLALHGDGENGPEFATPLVDVARANGWALIAPTIEYAEAANDPEQIATVIARSLPTVKTIVDHLEGQEGVPLRQRILIFGRGRGANTARLFGLFYPRSVAAVAGVGPAPCIVPAKELDGQVLPLPYGLDDLEQYVGADLDPEALAQVAFWIGMTSSATSTGGCSWGALVERPSAERARIFADQLGQLGARVEIVTVESAGNVDNLRSRALSFLQAHDPRGEP
jgi:hypothetical protein